MRTLTCAALLFCPAPASADDHWPRFRGPNGSGTSAADIPAVWGEREIVWKVPVGGEGYSSPVVWGDRVFLTAADPETNARSVIAFAVADGERLWERRFDGHPTKSHKRNGPATPTPALDAERVYTLWGSPHDLTVIALTHDGEPAWTASLGKFQGGHGAGVSPIRHGDLLIVPNDQDRGGSIIALDAATGEKRWELPRRGRRATYSTPCVYAPAGGEASLVFTEWEQGVTAVDPDTGRVRWEHAAFDTAVTQRAVASPVVADGRILATCGFVSGKKRLVALRPADEGGSPEEMWDLTRAVSYLPTPVVKDGLVFLCSEAGVATCLDLKTGEELWQERVGGNFYSSPVCAGDKLFCTSDDGTVRVLAAAKEFDLLATNRLGEPMQATPAVAAASLFLRGETHLFRVARPAE